MKVSKVARSNGREALRHAVPLHLVCLHAVAHVQQGEQPAKVLVPVADPPVELTSEIFDQALVGAALPLLLAGLQLRLRVCHEYLEQTRLVAPKALACEVDDVSDVLIGRSHGKEHHAAVSAASRLTLDLATQVLGVQLCEARMGAVGRTQGDTRRAECAGPSAPPLAHPSTAYACV